ncbi:unnamed protein product [Haemonchus placei]|uniref:DUF148 domain-containing protein n=1 Tax=Haemonchus placei TaxID=6290 RepID=A0A0N4X255_HAEPC|nr:unnamed protein product [Haemonchus placei]
MDWAVKYGIENQVKEYNTYDARTRKEIRYNVTKLIDDLPLAIDRFFDVMDDEYQTREERRKELEDISAQNPKENTVAVGVQCLYSKSNHLLVDYPTRRESLFHVGL